MSRAIITTGFGRAGITACLAIASLVIAASLPAPSAAIENSGRASGSVPIAKALATATAASEGGGWSRERLLAAKPLDQPGAGEMGRASQPRSDGQAGVARTVPYRSKRLQTTTSYPNRVHGKVFGRLGALGDFSCSGTVVTSGAGSLIATAGHCVFDRQAGFVTELLFIPGYDKGRAPLGQWQATHVASTPQWVRAGNSDYDVAVARIAAAADGATLQSRVGSRGIAFDQPMGRKLTAFGYPAAPAPYDGGELVRCQSRRTSDIARHSGRRSLGMGCDMQQGSSGGGWVDKHGLLVSNVSHAHPGFDKETFYGPDYGAAVRKLYKLDQGGFPSVGPARCAGKIADVVGTGGDDKLRGSKAADVIVTYGGDDKIRGKGGNDLICAGDGDDVLIGNAGKDRLIGAGGRDRCSGGGGKDRATSCERAKGIR